MNKEALEALNDINLTIKLLNIEYDIQDIMPPLRRHINTIKQALTQEVSKDTNVEEVLKAVDRIDKNVIDYKFTYEYEQQVKDFKTIRNYINRLDFLEKLNKCNRYVIDVPKEVDDEDIQQMLSSLLVDALLGCNAQTDNEAKREIMKNRVVKNINTITDLLLTKDVPNQSAKEIKPPLMVLKTNVGNCVVCDNQVTSEENYCSECGVQLKELQND